MQALVWERAGTRNVTYELAAPDASRVRGPFWSGAVTGGVVIAWAERPSRARPGDAPILGLTYRVESIDALGDGVILFINLHPKDLLDDQLFATCLLYTSRCV